MIHTVTRSLELAAVLSAIGGLSLLVFRSRVSRWLRLAKAAATDRRLPAPVRWVFRCALLIKCSPIDFGIDEALLLVGVALLAGPYRGVWSEIRNEVR